MTSCPHIINKLIILIYSILGVYTLLIKIQNFVDKNGSISTKHSVDYTYSIYFHYGKAIVMQRYASHSIICLLASRCVDAAGASVFNCIHTLMTINAKVLASIDPRGPWAWGLLEACSQKFTTPKILPGVDVRAGPGSEKVYGTFPAWSKIWAQIRVQRPGAVVGTGSCL